MGLLAISAAGASEDIGSDAVTSDGNESVLQITEISGSGIESEDNDFELEDRKDI